MITIAENDMCVDDLVVRGNNLEEVKDIKQNSAQLFKKRGFNLNKCNSNERELERERSTLCNTNIKPRKPMKQKYCSKVGANKLIHYQ